MKTILNAIYVRNFLYECVCVGGGVKSRIGVVGEVWGGGKG